MSNQKIWFVTGASKGLGLALVKKLLATGYRVAATSRATGAFTNLIHNSSGNFLPLQVDLTNVASVQAAIATTINFFGSIDVVVNNAGYGIGGTVEELDAAEIKQSFDVNVFGAINVMQQAIPHLRKQRSGHIINIASITGFAPAVGWGMYAATKYALMGLSEVLAEDLKEFGVHVTVVAPGAFRTQFLSQDSLVLSKKQLPEYTLVRQTHAKYLGMDGMQQGDPGKAAEAFIALAENPAPPVRLFLGSDAYNRAKTKIQLLTEELESWKAFSMTTDFNGLPATL